jgi:RND family efflux transporter MFP subunit
MLLCWSIVVLAQDIKVVLFPFQETQIAARLDSIVLPYHFKIGEQFKKGNIICSLDASRYELEVSKMTDNYEFAKALLEDKKRLHANKFTSDYELKKAEFDMNMPSISLKEAKLNLSFCSIIAPFDGKITEIITKEYELCRSGQPVIRIINDSKLLASANVPLKQKQAFKVGSEVLLKLIDGTTVQGTVYEISPQADHRSETVRIKILVENSQGKITSGITGVLRYGK